MEMRARVIRCAKAIDIIASMAERAAGGDEFFL